MNTVRKHVGLRSVSLVLVLLFFGGFAALSESAHAQTWGKLYHGPWTEFWSGTTFYGVLPTEDGGYLLTGSSSGRGVILKVSDNGELEWSKLIKKGRSWDTQMIRAVEAANGDFIVTGNVDTDTTIYPEAGAGSWDIYVIRLKPTGERVWEKLYGRKNLGAVPDTHEVPHNIYKNCPEGGGPAPT